uniref:Uncharacterized protein n=1 Tax=Clytia hemisphaerica TaxID=252671 RepID=A0A7M5UY38_9CNID
MDCSISTRLEKNRSPKIINTIYHGQPRAELSREVVKATKSVAEKMNYEYKEGIVMPLENFPSGCDPLFVDSFKEAVMEARKRANEGILVIVDYHDDLKDYSGVLNQLNEHWKAYHECKSDFKDQENPYKFLHDGNVLLIDEFGSYGFDWYTVIIFEQMEEGGGEIMHDCNYMLRCTTNLIVVKSDDENLGSDSENGDESDFEDKINSEVSEGDSVGDEGDSVGDEIDSDNSESNFDDDDDLSDSEHKKNDSENSNSDFDGGESYSEHGDSDTGSDGSSNDCNQQ